MENIASPVDAHCFPSYANGTVYLYINAHSISMKYTTQTCVRQVQI